MAVEIQSAVAGAPDERDERVVVVTVDEQPDARGALFHRAREYIPIATTPRRHEEEGPLIAECCRMPRRESVRALALYHVVLPLPAGRGELRSSSARNGRPSLAPHAALWPLARPRGSAGTSLTLREGMGARRLRHRDVARCQARAAHLLDPDRDGGGRGRRARAAPPRMGRLRLRGISSCRRRPPCSRVQCCNRRNESIRTIGKEAR